MIGKIRCDSIVIDPICKMEVDKEKAKYVSEYKGQKYNFCTKQCKEEFDETPKKYVKD